jgi:hypothetical protein
LSFQGIPYKRGGMSFNGIDCSGLVSLIFKSFGIDVPRTAREQFLMGEPVEMEELKPGDLLFFFTQRTSLPAEAARHCHRKCQSLRRAEGDLLWHNRGPCRDHRKKGPLYRRPYKKGDELFTANRKGNGTFS